MKKKLNLNELIWFLILTGFTYYFYMIISTNKITLFVHPKMVKYVKFALVFFIILAIFQGKNIFSDKKAKTLKIGYIMFLIPLSLGILLKSEGLSVDSVINKGFSLTSQLKISTLNHKHTLLPDGTQICEYDEKNIKSTENTNVAIKNSLESMEPVKVETMDMTNENFKNNYEDIYENSNNYVGRAISIKGFIYNQKGLNKDEFILSRIVVSCCMADAQLWGLLCDYSSEKIFTEGTWVNIEGTLGQREYQEFKSGEISMIPTIKVNKIERSDKQDNEYLYN
ncbi:TIGR03943 family protein [Clostridium sp.]|uniref:TIGR03943 family putative permease subunit n=1 Tax=Clostridium sp. TaxID=1506 RepID=UPI001A626C0D|nr:TIGR03943 family protein [Clostridium sp.]MBK5235947.1 TIGR03943 family protein [Clostridium sp.]